MSRRSPRSNELTGGLIAVVFGLVFIEANCRQLPHAWPVPVRVAGALIAAVLIAALSRARRRGARTESAPRSRPGFGRGYWAVVAAEVVALVAGLVVIEYVIKANNLTVAWIAFIVGIHFLGLGVVWKAAVFHLIGAVLALLGVAGCVIYAASGPAWLVAVVSGVVSGLVLYAAVARQLVIA